MGYRTTSGPERGPFKGRKTRRTKIGVIDENCGRPWPVGVATADGLDGDGVRLWRLVLDDILVPGRWIVVDRRFRPVR